jgi:hypothetical protein
MKLGTTSYFQAAKFPLDDATACLSFQAPRASGSPNVLIAVDKRRRRLRLMTLLNAQFSSSPRPTRTIIDPYNIDIVAQAETVFRWPSHDP